MTREDNTLLVGHIVTMLAMLIGLATSNLTAVIFAFLAYGAAYAADTFALNWDGRNYEEKRKKQLGVVWETPTRDAFYYLCVFFTSAAVIAAILGLT